MYNLSTKKETPITTNGSASNPKIYENRIIWKDYRNGDIQNFSNSDIFVYDISTQNETQITSNISDGLTPDIYGDKIVWCANRHESENSDIYIYDLSTSSETQINGNESIKGGLAIFGDKIVWAEYHDEKSIIYMYNLSTSKKTQIATSSNQPYSFAIYEDKVVWAESHNSLVIYMYDFSTQKKIQITTNGSSPLEPVIYGDKIVWIGGRNGNSGIYMCVVSKEGQEPLKPVADFSAVPTYGMAPLKVLFTDNSTGGPTSWIWDFGDGINSKHALNATHTFTEPGKYNISLIVMNPTFGSKHIPTSKYS
ncbi:hypothetical protein ASJ81_14185 [Methanosarcina spelaei]|uniref:PKD domain-containing protein n=2 Tax=Methanosarcina spelaei TaxID=1036679 RepID=A0A2A2HY69_9EURY|nr:hypothetical protein ASJ81_14185 [Methanosarcina spelaei]